MLTLFYHLHLDHLFYFNYTASKVSDILESEKLFDAEVFCNCKMMALILMKILTQKRKLIHNVYQRANVLHKLFSKSIWLTYYE